MIFYWIGVIVVVLIALRLLMYVALIVEQRTDSSFWGWTVAIGIGVIVLALIYD